MKTRIVILVLTVLVALVEGQTGKTPIKNGILQSDLDAAGYKITNANLVDYAGVNITWNTTTKKFDATGGGGGGGNVSNSGTPTAGQKALWVDATHIQGVTDNSLQWDGGATSLVSATGRTSLGLVIGTNVEAWDADLDAIAVLAGQTSFGRGFLTQANAAGARTYIGAGTSNFDGAFTSLTSTPTTLSGYGITDAQPLDGDLTSLAAASGTNTIYYRSATNTWSPVTIGGNMTFSSGTLNSVAGGGGTVTDFSAGDLSPLFTTTETTTTTTPALSFALSTTTAANTVYGRAAGTVGAASFSSSPQFTAIGNLTSNGFVKTGGGVGTLSVDTSTYLTANQNISLTGDVTGGPAATSIATTIANNVVSLGKMATMATDSILGRATASTGNVEVLSALPFAFTGDVTRPVDSNVQTIANSAVTYAKMQNVSANSVLLGSNATGSGSPPSEIVLGTNLSMSGSTLNAASGGGVSGSDKQVQFNDGGSAFGGNAGLTFDKTTTVVTETATDAVTSGITFPLVLAHNSTGTAANLFGTGIKVKAEDSTTDNIDIGSIRWIWTAVTHNSTASSIILSADTPGSLDTPVARFSGAGGLMVGNGVTNDEAAGVIDAATGYRIGNAAVPSGRILIGNGTNYIGSAPTYPTTAGTAGYNFRSDGTNFSTYPMQIVNSSTASQSPSTSDVYLTGSNCTVAAGDFKQKGQYRCLFDMTKSAGTGAIVLSVRVGTAGAIGDPAVLTYTFGVGTSVADTGIFEVTVTWRSVGSGTSAVVQGICRGTHNLATTGLFNNADAWTIVATTSAGFNSSTATNIGVSFNGSTAFAGTTTLVQASLQQ
jgi:Repeat of unknown function (DUF5907)